MNTKMIKLEEQQVQENDEYLKASTQMRVSKKAKDLLYQFKKRGESDNETLVRILETYEVLDDFLEDIEAMNSEAFKESIKEAREDFKEGNYSSLKEIIKDLFKEDLFPD